MDELTIGDKIYISSKQAAKITGYAKDYVGQLCREGRVDARLVGRNWYVLESSIREHRFGAAPEAIETAPEPVSEPEISPVAAWEPATYAPVQEESHLPPLAAPQAPEMKPEAAEAVALMQDAWKEWFAARAETAAAVQEPAQEESEAPEEETEEGAEEVRESDIPNIYNVSEVSHTEVEEDEVQLSRMPVDEESEVMQEYRPAPVSHVLDVSQRRSYPQEAVIDLSHAQEVAYEPVDRHEYVPRRKRRRAAARSGLTMQAVFIAFAGLAIVIAVIGSGALDHLLLENGVRDGFRGSIFEAIRGETRVNK